MAPVCAVQPSHSNISDALARLGSFQFIQVNLYGIVTDCNKPWKSVGGTDYYCTLYIYDESTQESIQLMCFCPMQEWLPDTSCVGNIIYLFNVKLKMYKDKPQLLLQLRYNHEMSYCLFRGSKGAALEPYYLPPSSSGYTLGAGHPAVLQRLRQLCHSDSDPPSATDAYMRRVKDLYTMAQGSPTLLQGQQAQAVDLRCKIVATERDASGALVLWIWDCTDAPPFPIRDSFPPPTLPSAGEQPLGIYHLQKRALPLQAGTFGSVTVELGDVPPVGTVMPVLVVGSLVKQPLPALGAVVKLKSMAVALVQGQLQGVFYTRSYWSDIAQPGYYDKALASRTGATCLNEWVDGPQATEQQVLTECTNTEAPGATIRQVLQAASEGKFGTFRVTAKVVRMTPTPEHLEDMCRPGQEVGLPGSPMPVWLLRLHLADPTGELDAVILGPDGTKLFGLVPTSLKNDTIRLEELRLKVERIASQGYPGTTGWLTFCIRSYCLDSDIPMASAAFRVEDTRIV